MLRLGGEVQLGGALLRLGGSERAEIRASASPRRRSVRKNEKMDQIWPFLPEIYFQTKTNSTKTQNKP